jgi:hypothetical protein
MRTYEELHFSDFSDLHVYFSEPFRLVEYNSLIRGIRDTFLNHAKNVNVPSIFYIKCFVKTDKSVYCKKIKSV